MGCTKSEVEDAVPLYTSVRSLAYRKRMKLVPTLPTKLSELILENEWRSTNDGKDFLLGCDGIDDKIVIFGTEGFSRRLCSSEIIFMDGTFISTSAIYPNLYIAQLCRRNNDTIGVCIATEQKYSNLFWNV
ncbi:hypothetical protein ACI65C_003877 [Semiaphis heraclei]